MAHNSGMNLSQYAQYALELYQQEIQKIYQDIVERVQQQRLDSTPEQARRFAPRLDLAFYYFRKRLASVYEWLFLSNEDTNFTYDITEQNKLYFASTIGLITGCPSVEIRSYIDELNNDQDLRRHIQRKVSESPEMQNVDSHAFYGRRVGWYAIVRALKPKVVVETGVDKGMGSCVLSLALLRNAQEGAAGKYYGTDINPGAGFLYSEPYNSTGQVLYGDSLGSLSKLNEKIDVFINDSDHSMEYEAREYALLHERSMLADGAVVLGDNSHVSPELCKFAQNTGMNFLFLPEQPEGHWYPGAGIGLAFRGVRQRNSIQKDKAELKQDTAHTSTAPQVGKHKCVFLNTFYPKFMESFYSAHPELIEASYEKQLLALQREEFGDSDYYSKGLIAAGWVAEDLIINCAPLQAAWAREHNSTTDLSSVLTDQIREIQPDVVYIQDMHFVPAEVLRELRQFTKLIVGQIASPCKDLPVSEYDIIFSAYPFFVENFRKGGAAAFLQPLAFNAKLARMIGKPYAERGIPLSFVGGLSGAHPARYDLLQALASKFPLEVWGYGKETLSADSPILTCHRGEAWGMEMFNLLGDSRITLNMHIQASYNGQVNNDYAANMRLYEATGAGALLITDYKDNLNEIFEIGKEIVAYRSNDEAIELVQYYFNHPVEAEQIAQAGQSRTLTEHTYTKRLNKMAEILERALKSKKEADRYSPVDYSHISYGYSEISKSNVTDEYVHSWQKEEMAVKQRALVQQELSQMYSGTPSVVAATAAEALRPYVRNNTTLLELGCASGYQYEILEYLLSRRLNYTGVDYSEAMISMAEEYYPQARFLCADGANVPLEDRAFEIVLTSALLLHCPNYEDHVAETVRLAGRVVVAHRTPIRRLGPTSYWKKMAYGVETVELRFNEQEIVQLFCDQGLKLVRQIEFENNASSDEYDVSYVFERR